VSWRGRPRQRRREWTHREWTDVGQCDRGFLYNLIVLIAKKPNELVDPPDDSSTSTIDLILR
jgi:hypothetical protein